MSETAKNDICELGISTATLPNNRELYGIVRERRFAVEYQPIVDTKTREIFAYEALARFSNGQQQSLPPDAVFHVLHSNPLLLFQVEYQVKQVQIEHAPKDHPLFLNMDPDAFAVFHNDGQIHPMVDLLCEHQGNELVLEIIENSNISDARISENMACTFHKRGVKLALDDIGATHSLVPLRVLMAVDYMKLDKHWLETYHDHEHRTLLHSLIAYAKFSNKRTVLEGVERPDQLELAEEIGIDYVQGFLFRDRFITPAI